MAKTAGVDVLLKVNTGTIGVPVWTVVGGQTGATLNRSASTIETTDKQSAGWTEALASFKSWGLECDSFVVLGDAGLEKLIANFASKADIQVQIRVGAVGNASGYTLTGFGVITDFPEEYPQDDAVTMSLTIVGNGALTRTVSA